MLRMVNSHPVEATCAADPVNMMKPSTRPGGAEAGGASMTVTANAPAVSPVVASSQACRRRSATAAAARRAGREHRGHEADDRDRDDGDYREQDEQDPPQRQAGWDVWDTGDVVMHP